MCDQDLLKRQNALAGVNIAWLHQALDAIEGLDDEGYALAGAQFRHVIEFYECFLEGLAVFHIDYDGRRRDLVLEQQRRVAGARIRTLINACRRNRNWTVTDPYSCGWRMRRRWVFRPRSFSPRWGANCRH